MRSMQVEGVKQMCLSRRFGEVLLWVYCVGGVVSGDDKRGWGAERIGIREFWGL